jgi:hypothetical protein
MRHIELEKIIYRHPRIADSETNRTKEIESPVCTFQRLEFNTQIIEQVILSKYLRTHRETGSKFSRVPSHPENSLPIWRKRCKNPACVNLPTAVCIDLTLRRLLEYRSVVTTHVIH